MEERMIEEGKDREDVRELGGRTKDSWKWNYDLCRNGVGLWGIYEQENGIIGSSVAIGWKAAPCQKF
jgi:hypothetical protein